MNWPDVYTFAAEDFFTGEAQEIGRLLLERNDARWVLLALRAESTGCRWVATWCGLEHEEAHRLPLLGLGSELCARLDAAPRIDVGEVTPPGVAS